MIAKRDIVAGTLRPEQLGDLGKSQASNRGGYQSLSNIFDTWSKGQTGTLPPLQLAASPRSQAELTLPTASPTECIEDPQEVAGQPHLRNLHRIASEALDQARARLEHAY